MINSIVLMGRLTANPELKTTPSGTSVTSFALAVERNYATKGQERQTDFVDVVAWRSTAEFVCRYFGKGDMLALTGKLQTRSYEDRQGNKRKAVEVVAETVSFCGGKNGGNADRTQKNGAPQSDEEMHRHEEYIDIDDGDLPF